MRTVDGALELLAADLAVERAAAGLLFELDLDRLFVVAEEACEGRRERVALAGKAERLARGFVSWEVVLGEMEECTARRTFLGPWGLLELLRLPIVIDVYRDLRDEGCSVFRTFDGSGACGCRGCLV
jgi:hypothetical protein